VWAFHGPAIAAAGATVVAVHDLDPRRAEAAARELGVPTAATLEELLGHDADVAVVLAPHPAHAELTLAAVRAGRHVLVEKPLAVTVGEADAVVAAARAAQRIVAVAFQQRTRSEVQEALRLVRAGALGELQRVVLVASWPRRASYYRLAPWRGTWQGEGGGVLLNQGPHDLDLLCLLAGLPARVTARTRTAVHAIETEDGVSALLEWEGGATGSLHLSTAEVDEPQRLELTGTHGRLRLRPGRLELWRNEEDVRDYVAGAGDPFGAPRVQPAQLVTGTEGTHALLYANLADAVAGRADPVAPAAEARWSLELANALIWSGQRRASVDLPLDREGYDRLLAELRR
jgi:predicted dehydrogenase